MYFLNKFYTFFCVSTFFITNPSLPKEPELPPKSSKKKFITCSGFLSSCLQIFQKFVIAVFLVPYFVTLGGIIVILVFQAAKSGLFLLSVSVIRFSSYLYRFQFFFFCYSSLTTYWLFLPLSPFFFFSFSFLKSTCSNSSNYSFIMYVCMYQLIFINIINNILISDSYFFYKSTKVEGYQLFSKITSEFYIFKQLHDTKMDPNQEENDIDLAREQYKKAMQQQLSNFEHEKKKLINQMKSDLEFEKIRANQFQQKYKNAIKYRNEEEEMKKILNELNETIKKKEAQILEHLKAEQQRKRKIGDLESENEELEKGAYELREQLDQIKEGAIAAIVEKDSIITDLQQKIMGLQNNDESNIENTIIQLQEKYRDLQQKSDAQRIELDSIIENRQQQIRELRQKMQIQRQRYEQRIVHLEQDIIQLQKHIQKINEERHYQENLQQKYFQLEQRLRKSQKKSKDQEQSFKDERVEFSEAFQKLQNQIASMKNQEQEIKVQQTKVKDLEKEIKLKKKQNQDSKSSFQKMKSEFGKKINLLEQDKKKISENLQVKIQQIERIRLQMQEKAHLHSPTKVTQSSAQKTPQRSALSIDLQAPSIKSGKKQSYSEQQKLNKKIKDQQETIQVLNTKLEQQTKQMQNLREKLVSSSGSAGRSDKEAELLIKIQDLNVHVKKLQHDMLLKKLNFAEDENHWKSKERELKFQIDKITKKSRKQKLELIEKIDRMRKNAAKDKKMDFYTSSLK